METQNVLLEIKDRVAIVTVNRPGKLNALNGDTITALADVMSSANDNPEVRCVILTGAGPKSFVAGADISEIQTLNIEEGANFSRMGQQVFRYIENMRKPVLAAVNGFALGGGCELAMACHLRIAAENARFGLPEINLGIIPGYGGTQRLPRLVGLSNALHLALTGDMIDAEDAHRLGLVSEVVPAAELMERAEKLAKILASKAPLAAGFILDAVYEGVQTDIDSALDIEAGYFGKVCETEDMKEGTAAFLEKRKPNFEGK